MTFGERERENHEWTMSNLMQLLVLSEAACDVILFISLTPLNMHCHLFFFTTTFNFNSSSPYSDVVHARVPSRASTPGHFLQSPPRWYKEPTDSETKCRDQTYLDVQEDHKAEGDLHQCICPIAVYRVRHPALDAVTDLPTCQQHLGLHVGVEFLR